MTTTTQEMTDITNMTDSEVAELLNVDTDNDTDTDYSAYFNQYHEDIADVFREEAPTIPTRKKFINMLTDSMFTYTGQIFKEATDIYVSRNAVKTMFMKMDKVKAKELLDLAEHYKQFTSNDIKTYRDLIN